MQTLGGKQSVLWGMRENDENQRSEKTICAQKLTIKTKLDLESLNPKNFIFQKTHFKNPSAKEVIK